MTPQAESPATTREIRARKIAERQKVHALNDQIMIAVFKGERGRAYDLLKELRALTSKAIES